MRIRIVVRAPGSVAREPLGGRGERIGVVAQPQVVEDLLAAMRAEPLLEATEDVRLELLAISGE